MFLRYFVFHPHTPKTRIQYIIRSLSAKNAENHLLKIESDFLTHYHLKPETFDTFQEARQAAKDYSSGDYLYYDLW